MIISQINDLNIIDYPILFKGMYRVEKRVSEVHYAEIVHVAEDGRPFKQRGRPELIAQDNCAKNKKSDESKHHIAEFVISFDSLFILNRKFFFVIIH